MVQVEMERTLKLRKRRALIGGKLFCTRGKHWMPEGKFTAHGGHELRPRRHSWCNKCRAEDARIKRQGQ